MRNLYGALAALGLALLSAIPFTSLAEDTLTNPVRSQPTSTLSPPPEELSSKVIETFVDGIVAAQRREHDAPGVTVSVVRNGKVLFAKGYGLANVEKRVPVSGEDTLFQIGSVSKTFIWTSVMILWERGQIDLDADVNTYLKGFQIPPAFGAPVTMDDLMAHRAGFEDSLAGFTRLGTHPDESLSDYLAHTIPERVFPPGARTSYSNWGATLAAKIVEDISGVPYEVFLEREILKPLAMSHTTLVAPKWMTSAVRDHAAVGYRVRNGIPAAAANMPSSRISPAGSMSSSAGDMARWMLFHLGGGTYDGVTLLQPATHELMWTRAFSDRATGADAAHGFYNKSIQGVNVYGHGGATSAFLTDMIMAPSLDGLGVFVSQNAIDDLTLVSNLTPLLIARLNGSIVPGEPPATTSNNASAYAGTYLNNRRVFSKFERLFYSAAGASVAPTGDGGLAVSALVGGSQKLVPVPGAPDTFMNADGDRIVFGRDKEGNVTHFSDGGGFHSYEKVGFRDNGAWLYLAVALASLFAITTLLGAWRRQGRTGAETRLSAALGYAALATALLVLVFDIALGTMAAGLTSGIFGFFANYPPTSVTLVRILAPILCGLAIAGVIGVWFVWRKAAWGKLRKVNFTLFALSVAFLAIMLEIWNAVLVPLS